MIYLGAGYDDGLSLRGELVQRRFVVVNAGHYRIDVGNGELVIAIAATDAVYIGDCLGFSWELVRDTSCANGRIRVSGNSRYLFTRNGGDVCFWHFVYT